MAKTIRIDYFFTGHRNGFFGRVIASMCLLLSCCYVSVGMK